MSKEALCDYLAGKTTELLEYSLPPTGTGSSGFGGTATVRGEKLVQHWDELLVKLWALWHDILDENERIYEDAKQALDEIRNTSPDHCRAAQQSFKMLYRVLEKYVYIDKYTPEPALKLYLARQKYLNEELEWICDQFDPEVPRPPETPTKSREEWDRARKQKAREEKEVRKTAEQAPGNPASTFVDQSRQNVGKDQAGKNNLGKTTARGKVSKGGDNKASKKTSDKKDTKKSDKKTKPEPASKKDTKKLTKKADKKVEKKPNRKTKKVRKESFEASSSIVMASLTEAMDSVDLETGFLEAGASIQACMETHTDVSCAHTEIGESMPGTFPRLDLFSEWSVGDRPSDCYGYARLWFLEAEGLYVLDAQDRVRDVLRIDEGLNDEEVAERLYRALDEVYDASPERIWTENRVVPALYRLLDRGLRGDAPPASAFAQILDGLRGKLGLHESVRVPGSSIRLQETVAEGSENSLNYHFSWATQTPLTHRRSQSSDALNSTDSVWQFSNWGTKVEAATQVVEMQKKLLEQNPNDLALRVSIQNLEKRLQDLGGGPIQEGPHYRTPDIHLDLSEGCAYVVIEGKKEKIKRTDKDEDVMAKIATQAFQKESEDSVVEPVLNKPGSPLQEAYSNNCLKLEKDGDAYVAHWRDRTIGRVEKQQNGSWSVHTNLGESIHSSPYLAAAALACSQGLVESKIERRVLDKVRSLSPTKQSVLGEAIHASSGDLVRSVVHAVHNLDLAENWRERFELQLEDPDRSSLTEALVDAVDEMGLSGTTACKWAVEHWREYL